MKFGRNDLCWCGSNQKYKKCHMEFDEKLAEYKRNGVIVPSRKMIKNEEQIEGIRESGKLNTEILDIVSEHIRAGISTEDLNSLVHNLTIERNAVPAPLNYEGFPKSVCISINEEVCHGIPDSDVVLEDGDIVNVDVTTIYNGYYADASRMFMIGDVDEKSKKLVQVAKECLELGVKAARPWGFLGDIGAAIEPYARKNGFSIVRGIGGHGVGIGFHEDPYVSHVGKKGTGVLLVPGMTFTIEPMVNMGTSEVVVDEDNGWTIYTEDGLPSAQWEYTVLITEDGVEILTH